MILSINQDLQLKRDATLLKVNKMQIVFLFDLNAFIEESRKCEDDLQRQLLCLRVACLRILTHYSTSVSNLKWGFKFFDSKGSLTQTMQSFSFPNVSLENYEILENELCTKYQRHASYLEALVAASNQSTAVLKEESNSEATNNIQIIRPIQVLHLALTQVLYEYQWNDCAEMFSPSTTKKRTHNQTQKKNLLFFISKCVSSDAQFQSYFGVDCLDMAASKFTNILLSPSLNKKLLHEASILWIWLNTSADYKFLGNSKPSSIMTVTNALNLMKCPLVPLTALSKPNYHLKLKRKEEENEILPSDVFSNFRVPFSSVLLHYMSYPFYLEKPTPSNEATIHVKLKNMTQFQITVFRIPLFWNRERNNLSQDLNEDKKCTDAVVTDKSIIWRKFTAQVVVPRIIHLKSDDMLFLFPKSFENSSYYSLKNFISSLLFEKYSLLVMCESDCGTIAPAILSPISESSAIIAILDSKTCFLNSTDLQYLDFSKQTSCFPSNIWNGLVKENGGTKQFVKSSETSNLKPFQVESTEPWYASTQSIPLFLQEYQESEKRAVMMQSFQDKVNIFYKSLKSQKTKTSDLVKNVSADEVVSDETKLEKIEDLNKDVDFNELISILNETYDVALKSNQKVLFSAKKIIKFASTFFLRKSILSYEENMKNFIHEYFCLNCRKVIEKYQSNNDEDATVKKVNECQLQAILALEMEVLFPSADPSICANNVRSFLGVLSFNSTPTEHNKFLSEVLKENYSHNLYEVLLEIGDELMMPDEDSVDSGNEDQIFGPMSDPLESVVSSNLSVKSASSTSSRGENRKLIKKRSDISDTNKSRQVLLPGKSPKQKKAKSSFFSEKNPIRYSPRLASQKKRNKFKTVDSKPESARRNLFPKDRKPRTPRTSSVKTPRKKKQQTPKTHHVLKTSFVPETPSYKQNQSALQRRKSQMDISSPNLEVAESPVILKNSQGSDIFDRLQKLKEGKMSLTNKQESSSASCSLHPHHTPESKRRLSLKLFSKVLTSPTARMGLKKCSKRLFDQISPRVCGLPCKKMKLEDNNQKQNITVNSKNTLSQKIAPKEERPELA